MTSSLDNSHSRYVKGGITDVYPNRLGWWERFIFAQQSDDVQYVIEQKYNIRPDSLAYDVYGSPVYMWVILQYNNIIDVNVEFVTGVTILLPTPSRVKSEMA